MKNIKQLWFFLFALILLGSVFPAQAGQPNPKAWHINKALMFHLGYYSDNEFKDGNPLADFGYTEAYLPDISNINLKSFLELGFSVPSKENAHDYGFFLKFFKYPGLLDQKASTAKIVSAFYLNKTTNFTELKELLDNKNNVVVKKGLIDKLNREFTKRDPFPPLRDAKEMTQSIFDSNVVFSSVYLDSDRSYNGLSKNEAVDISNDGVSGFYSEINRIYHNRFLVLHADSESKQISFISQKKCIGDLCNLSVLSLPDKPMLFDAVYKTLPMPQGPNNIFLTGLLLIYNDDYEVPKKQLKKVLTGSDLQKYGKKIKRHVLEVGSVIDLSKI